MIVYRISRCAFINDLSGYGASQYPGRWNSKGVRMLYTAQSASLATLETVVHIAGLKLTAPYCLAELDLPSQMVTTIDIEDLPGNWKAYPAPEALKRTGDRFIKAGKFLALRVPSAVVPEDFNYLVNPLHKSFPAVKVVSQRPFVFDGRLLK